MSQRTIHITEFDRRRLAELLDELHRTGYTNREALQDLEGELSRAVVVAPQDVPPDVITMNSQARLYDLDAEEELVFTLVFPEDANLAEDKVSVLAPIGMAMLGYRVGDVFEWQVPAGISRLKVLEILYQPEAAGDYHL
ncbi:MAG: Regulator of nucleoside diphosphate kinase [Chloroflexi bacterium ADurb.Bin360]|nr:MAG: Regulator of nucleoside diphosphate kinase [Chloroflexi bacterium ADurb.Bin360]